MAMLAQRLAVLGIAQVFGMIPQLPCVVNVLCGSMAPIAQGAVGKEGKAKATVSHAPEQPSMRFLLVPGAVVGALIGP